METYGNSSRNRALPNSSKGLIDTKRHLHLLLQVSFLLSQVLHVLPQVEILLDTGNSGNLKSKTPQHEAAKCVSLIHLNSILLLNMSFIHRKSKDISMFFPTASRHSRKVNISSMLMVNFSERTAPIKPRSFSPGDPLSQKVRGLALSSAYRVDHQSWNPRPGTVGFFRAFEFFSNQKGIKETLKAVNLVI